MAVKLSDSPSRRWGAGAVMAAFIVSILLTGCSPDASRSAAGEDGAGETTEQVDPIEEGEPGGELVQAVPPPGTCTDGATWMSCMFPSGDRTLASLIMPGSHDTGTYALTSDSDFVSSCAAMPRFVYSLAAGVVAKWAKTQTGSMGPQLQAGARYFDIRPAWFGNEWITCHTLTGASMEDITGANSELKQFVTDHPNEVIVLDLSHVYGTSDATTLGKLKTLIETNLGSMAYTFAPGRTFENTTLADVRAAKASIIVLGVPSVESSVIWPREPNLYTPWVDNSEPAMLFWNNRFGEAQLALNQRERESLMNDKAATRLTVLNYIWDSNCPLGDLACTPKYVAPGSLLSWTERYLVNAVPEFTRAMNYTAKKLGGRGFVVMRDDITVGSNQPIWEANK